MKVVERDGKKYLLLQENPEWALEIVEELPNGGYKVKTSSGNIITFGSPREPELTEEEKRALELLEEAEEEWWEKYGINERQEAILWFLLERNEPVPFKEIVSHTISKYNVSGAMVQKDVEKLLKKKFIEKVGGGLYKITKSGMSYLGVRPPGLFYECTEHAILKAIEMVSKAEKEGKIPEDLYMTLVDALDCLRDLGRMYKEEWDIEVPLD